MPSYDTALFNPPAPVVRVSLRNPITGSELNNVSMLLDSGADVTLIPALTVKTLGLNTLPEVQYEVIGHDNVSRLSPVVVLEMSFLGKIFRGRFLLTDAEFGIIGRNVMNSLKLVLDGPALNWDIAS